MGWKYRAKRGSQMERVARAYNEMPDASAVEIGWRLGINAEYVRATLRRLNLPPRYVLRPRKEPKIKSRHAERGPWTDDLEAKGRRLWAAKVSAREIAKALGHGITRNGVIGKANRMGWERYPSPPPVVVRIPELPPPPPTFRPFLNEPKPEWACREGGCGRTRLRPYERCQTHHDEHMRRKREAAAAAAYEGVAI